ncbi:MAG: Uma2 family endonuclease [Acidobacteriota bacterium]|nr:MAG: Uma2 family endonuclease [Acidobacteriota bacterium]
MATVIGPSGVDVMLHDVSWRTYESLLEDFVDRSSPRLTYDQGTLEIMSPTKQHEELNRILALLVDTASDELGLDVQSLGSTTFRREDLGRGFEPDSCFYFAEAARVRGKESVDLSVDPPPELVIEIDITSSSLPKDSIYATLGVPEVWRYDGSALRIGLLDGGNYVESTKSAVISILTADALSRFVELSGTATRPELLRTFREWIRSRR